MYGPTGWPWYVLAVVSSVQLLPLLAVRSGSVSPCWSLYRAIWLRSVWTVLRRLCVRASSLAPANCGMTIAARMPRMITTIRISTSVNPLFDLRRAFMAFSHLTKRLEVAGGRATPVDHGSMHRKTSRLLIGWECARLKRHVRAKRTGPLFRYKSFVGNTPDNVPARVIGPRRLSRCRARR